MIRCNRAKQKIKNGQPVFGTFVKMNDPSTVEVLGTSDIDFVVLENEHIGMNRETLVEHIRCCELCDIAPIVRIRINSRREIQQALDSGALGIQVPHVDTSDDARRVVDSAKFHPLGTRGFAGSNRTAGFGTMGPQEFATQSNENVLLVCQCESEDSLRNIDEILKEPQVDVIFVGHMDLTLSMGILGQLDHPRYVRAIDELIEKVRGAGKAFGLTALNAGHAKALVERGVQYISYGSDLGMIGAGWRNFRKALGDE